MGRVFGGEGSGGRWALACDAVETHEVLACSIDHQSSINSRSKHLSDVWMQLLKSHTTRTHTLCSPGALRPFTPFPSNPPFPPCAQEGGTGEQLYIQDRPCQLAAPAHSATIRTGSAMPAGCPCAQEGGTGEQLYIQDHPCQLAAPAHSAQSTAHSAHFTAHSAQRIAHNSQRTVHSAQYFCKAHQAQWNENYRAAHSSWPSMRTRKSSIFGARARIFAMCSAPASALMLLKRCSWRSSPLACRSSSTAAHAWMEHPTFCRLRLCRPACDVMADAHARTPFSPSALSLRLSTDSWHPARAPHSVRSASSASSSGRPAITSEMSAWRRLPATFAIALAATAAASRPKLFVLKRICAGRGGQIAGGCMRRAWRP
eukprot:278381-Chlamydomonas_euryale.AAC.9